MNKPEFKDIILDPEQICWGRGNDIVGLRCIARIQLREPTKKEEKKIKAQYATAKEIYERHINKGAAFKACGEKANKKIEAKITFINSEKQSVTWRQYNLTEEEIASGYKPAAGKWSINAMIRLVKTNEIKFFNDHVKLVCN